MNITTISYTRISTSSRQRLYSTRFTANHRIFTYVHKYKMAALTSSRGPDLRWTCIMYVRLLFQQYFLNYWLDNSATLRCGHQALKQMIFLFT